MLPFNNVNPPWRRAEQDRILFDFQYILDVFEGSFQVWEFAGAFFQGSSRRSLGRLPTLPAPGKLSCYNQNMSTGPQLTLPPLYATLGDVLANQPDVLAAYLFGSVARQQSNTLSDIDIAVLLRPGLNAEAMLERQLALVGALEDAIKREVQVVILNSAPPLLAYQVIREGVLLCEQDRLARIAFAVRTMKLYFDIQPRLEFHNQVTFRQIREVGLGCRRRNTTRTLEAAERIRKRLVGAAEH